MERGGKKRGVVKKRDLTSHPTRAIIKKAQEYVAECNYEMAQRFYEKALKQEPNNAKVSSLSENFFSDSFE